MFFRNSLQHSNAHGYGTMFAPGLSLGFEAGMEMVCEIVVGFFRIDDCVYPMHGYWRLTLTIE